MSRILLVVAAVALALVAVQAADNVKKLTPSDFDDIVGKDKPALVEFFAPYVLPVM